MELIQDCWQFLIGLGAGYVIHLLQVKIQNRTTTTQKGNVVGGDQAGRDINKK